ncbi:MAG: phage holin family protein [Anaerolineales bacterium]|nr:MAG: phage holin family protein [Anaerolineales bacterium]
MKLLVRWVISSLALFAAAYVVPGITVEGNAWIVYAVMAILLGLVNAFVRPLLKLLTCPLIILTLGLFTLVINAVSLWATSQLAQWLDIGFVVDDFGAALLGSLIVSTVTVVLTTLVKDDKKKH